MPIMMKTPLCAHENVYPPQKRQRGSSNRGNVAKITPGREIA